MPPLKRQRRDWFLAFKLPRHRQLQSVFASLVPTPFIIPQPVAPLALKRGHAPFLTCNLPYPPGFRITIHAQPKLLSL
jgi:hypothetical protein